MAALDSYRISGANASADAAAPESAFVAELQAASESAYARLIELYHRPIYSVIFRSLNNAADAADATQEVFIKVFRGILKFQGESSLKTWIFRIAIREASNHRRWWFRHTAKETSMELDVNGADASDGQRLCLRETLASDWASPFDSAVNSELRTQIEAALQEVSQPYRTTLILRDLEQMSYDEIAEISEVSLGTVKSRLTRGREMLRQRLAAAMGRSAEQAPSASQSRTTGERRSPGHRRIDPRRGPQPSLHGERPVHGQSADPRRGRRPDLLRVLRRMQREA